MEKQKGELLYTVNFYRGDSLWILKPDGTEFVLGDEKNNLTLLPLSISARMETDITWLNEHKGWAMARKEWLLRRLNNLGYVLHQNANQTGGEPC